MGHRKPIRLIAAAIAAGSLMAVPLSSPASAATPATCSKATFGKNTSKPVMTGKILSCTKPTATGGQGSFTSNYSDIKAIKSKITWAGGKGTTTMLSSMTVGKKPNKCGDGNRLNISGKVTGGTGAALKGIPKGSPFVMIVCLSPKLVTTLYPGTKVVV